MDFELIVELFIPIKNMNDFIFLKYLICVRRIIIIIILFSLKKNHGCLYCVTTGVGLINTCDKMSVKTIYHVNLYLKNLKNNF